MLKLLLAAAVACPRAVAINSKGAPSYEAKMNLFAKNNRGESCASDEGLSDIDQQLLYAANNGNDKIVEVCLADGANPNARYSWQITREPDLRVGNYRNFHGNYPGVEITGNLGGLTGSRAGAASPTCVWRPSARRAEPRVRDAMLYRFLRGEDVDAEGCWGARGWKPRVLPLGSF